MSDTALLVIDVQESFRHATYWSDAEMAPFSARLQALIDGAAAQEIPVVQVFHTAPAGPFAMESGHVRTLEPISIRPDATFHKTRHSALVGTGLDTWLTGRGIRRLIVSGIRTEQCCETTARHASDLGWSVDYVTEATLTFAMTHPNGQLFTPADIRARTELCTGNTVRPYCHSGTGAHPSTIGDRGMTDARRHMTVLVVLPPRALLLDLAGPLEVLRVAGTVQDRVAFALAYVAPEPVTCSSVGLALCGAGALPSAVEDGVVVLVPGSSRRASTPRGDAADDAKAEAAIVAWLREVIRPAHVLVTVCEGALLAARAGLLDGYACTTHHASCAKLADAAPRARVLENRLFVEDRNRYSSAGVTAGIDLMLHLVAAWAGTATALEVARNLLVYMRRGANDPQLSPWLEGRSHLHAAVHRAQDAIAADPARDWSLAELGRASGASARNLSRLFMTHAGMTTTAAINRARVARAHDLIRHSALGMEQVAEQAGFGSARHMRRVWRLFYPRSPTQMREAATAAVRG